MAKIILSVTEKQGEYQGNKYHNFYIYSIDPETHNQQVLVGGEVEIFKIKADDFVACLNRNFGALNDPEIKTVNDIINLNIIPMYNKYGGVIDFTLSVPKSKK